MKQVLLIMLWVFVSVQLHAQAYQPFPTDNANWTYIVWSRGSGTPYMTGTGMYYTNGTDTTINGKTYIKIMVRGCNIIDYDSFHHASNCIGTTDKYQCGIRENNKQLYIRESNDTAEHLLWDFNMTIGDSVKQIFEASGYSGPGVYVSTRLEVTNIDSVWVDGCFRKRFSLYGTYNYTTNIHADVIEGLGINGFFYSFPYKYVYSVYAFGPVCFTHNGYSYNPYKSDSCFYIFPSTTPSSIASTERTTLTIYPNPFKDILNINTEGTLQFYNSLGIKVLETVVTDNSWVNTSQLTTGMYYIVLRDNNNIILHRQKVIKE